MAELLVNDLQHFELGKIHDELNQKDVSVHACKLLNSKDDVIFLTPAELIKAQDVVSYAENDGYTVVPNPETVKE